VQRVRQQYKVDESRIYLMGHSMGAIGTWKIAPKFPDVWAALGLFAGTGVPATLEKARHIPQFVVHGDADATVSVTGSRGMVAQLKALGVEHQYIEVPGGSHGDVVAPNLAAMVEFFCAGRIDERAWWRKVHGEHAPQIAQAFILGNAFSNPAQLSDPLFELTPLNLPAWLCALPDRRALALREDAAYLLATDGFWSCAAPDRFVERWPDLLAGAPDAATMVARLFDTLEHDPPAGLHADNLTALVLRPVGRGAAHADETALPDGS